jgi:streptogramin lyase
MRGPGDVTIAPDGRVWVADTANGRFAIFGPDGTFVEYWEHLGSGPGEFILQRANGDGYGGMEFAPDGSFYVMDVGNHRVEHFDSNRQFIKAWGTGTQFPDPVAIDVDSHGLVYIFDDLRDVVESYDKDGHIVNTIPANPGAPNVGEGNSFTLDDAGDLFVSHCCDAGNKVVELGPDGGLLQTFGADGPGAFLSDQPGAVAIDSEGRVFVAVRAGAEIFGADGTFVGSFSSPDLVGDRGFFSGMALDGAGYGYAAEVGTDQLEKFQLVPPFTPTP